MDEKALRRKLLDMKSEVLALKTAHARGLGVTDFYEKHNSITTTQNFGGYITVTVNIASGETVPAFLIIARSDTFNVEPNAVSGLGGYSPTFKYLYSEDVASGTVLSFQAISASKISSIVLTESSL